MNAKSEDLCWLKGRGTVSSRLLCSFSPQPTPPHYHDAFSTPMAIFGVYQDTIAWQGRRMHWNEGHGNLARPVRP